jgi:predicted nucleic acid-binding protein
MLAYLQGEPGGSVVARLFLDTQHTCFVHAINLCEVFYFYHRRGGETDAQRAVSTLLAAGIVVREDLDEVFWQSVARLKSPRASLPLADAICVSLALRLNGEVVTADHPDFEPIAQLGVCPVLFIR